jgi:hypothetical protein
VLTREDSERRTMNAKKLMVGLVAAVTLTLFTAAVYAQQVAPPQEEDDAAEAYFDDREEFD